MRLAHRPQSLLAELILLGILIAKWNASSSVRIRLLNLLEIAVLLFFLFVAQHGFERAQDFLFVIQIQNLGKLRNFSTLLAASSKLLLADFKLKLGFHTGEFELAQVVGAD